MASFTAERTAKSAAPPTVPELYMSQQWPKDMPFFSNCNKTLKSAAAKVTAELKAAALAADGADCRLAYLPSLARDKADVQVQERQSSDALVTIATQRA